LCLRFRGIEPRELSEVKVGVALKFAVPDCRIASLRLEHAEKQVDSESKNENKFK
jgi:hypothetical protein